MGTWPAASRRRRRAVRTLKWGECIGCPLDEMLLMGYYYPIGRDGGQVMDEECRINVRTAPELKRRVKAAAALQGKTLADAVREALELWLARQEQKSV